jgi:hypothetical protein
MNRLMSRILAFSLVLLFAVSITSCRTHESNKKELGGQCYGAVCAANCKPFGKTKSCDVMCTRSGLKISDCTEGLDCPLACK